MTNTEILRSTGLQASAAYKAPCYLATTANITLAGEQTIDGTLTDESRVLVKDQTDATQNGIYLTSTGNWQRAPDFSRNDQIVEGTRVWVTDGATHGNLEWVLSSPNPISIDTDDLDWQRAVDLTPSADFGSAIHGAVAVTELQDADELGIWNSLTTALGKITWANIKTAVYAGIGSAINGYTGKTTPVDADSVVLSDSAASNAPKKLLWSNIKATIFSSWGALINGATGKTTPVDADAIDLMDSAASNATKKLTWANLKATLKTYFDTLYATVGTPANGYVLLETITLSGASSRASSASFANCREILVEVDAVSLTGASQALEFSLSTDGSNWGTALALGTLAAANSAYVTIMLLGVQQATDCLALARSAGLSAGSVAASAVAVAKNSAAALTNVRLATGGNNFDAGTMRIYGIKA